MMQRVVEAVNDGQRSGALGREEAAAALSAVTRELQSSVETVTFLSEAKPRAANPAMPMSRAVFEHALRVSPASGDPDEAAQARRTIAMHLDRHQPTPDDRDRARAWLREHDEWIGMQRSESQGEPSAEDLRAAPLRARGPLAAASRRRARFSGVLTFRAAFFVLP
jgi:hypothetical protein